MMINNMTCSLQTSFYRKYSNSRTHVLMSSFREGLPQSCHKLYLIFTFNNYSLTEHFHLLLIFFNALQYFYHLLCTNLQTNQIKCADAYKKLHGFDLFSFCERVTSHWNGSRLQNLQVDMDERLSDKKNLSSCEPCPCHGNAHLFLTLIGFIYFLFLFLYANSRQFICYFKYLSRFQLLEIVCKIKQL